MPTVWVQGKVWVIPQIDQISIKPVTVDEWFGIEAEILFKTHFDAAAYDAAVSAEMDRRWKIGRASHSGLTELEKAVNHHLAAELVRSNAWTEFYKTRPKATCQEYEDGPEREVTIPRFEPDDFDEVSIFADRAHLHATTR